MNRGAPEGCPLLIHREADLRREHLQALCQAATIGMIPTIPAF
jgi:hypothetical protein